MATSRSEYSYGSRALTCLSLKSNPYSETTLPLALLGVLVAGVDNVFTFHSFQNYSLFLWDPCSVLIPDRHSRLQSGVGSGFGFFAYNAPSLSVTCAKLLCQSPVLVPGFFLAGFIYFFLICQHVEAPLILFKKAKAVMSATIQLEVYLNICGGAWSPSEFSI